VEVECACPSGICNNSTLPSWEVTQYGENYVDIQYLGNDYTNPWRGKHEWTQRCVLVKCTEVLGCFTQPGGVPIDNVTCNYFSFYNTLAAGLCGFFMLLISFTGLARRDNAEDLRLCLQCRKDLDETIIEQKKRENWQNTRLRFTILVTVVLQVVDYALDIWCAVDYWDRDRLVLSYLTVATILFQLCTTTITKHPWTRDDCLIPVVSYCTGFGLVYEYLLA
jgi:hypothetical protein